MRKYITTITAEHVADVRTIGRDWRKLVECMGRLLPGDIGKQVFETSPGVWQVENSEQRDKRVARRLASVTRFVGTYVNKDGERTLIGPAQGRNTFATEAEAESYLRAVTENNSPETIRQVWGKNPRFEVRPCPCYPEHFDPQTRWFD